MGTSAFGTVTAAQSNPRTPFSALAKPAGAACNLDCEYCFFLSKELLYDEDGQRMDDSMLRTYIRDFLDSQPDGDVSLEWQGGEPTLRGIPFFRRAVELADEYRRPGQRVSHSLQTNGTLLNDEWGEFLAENGFLVGLSMDGPAECHDTYRVNKAGRATHAQVLRAWRILQAHGVETNILCTVHAANQDRPLDVYRYFRDELGAVYIQFIPIVERVSRDAIAGAGGSAGGGAGGGAGAGGGLRGGLRDALGGGAACGGCPTGAGAGSGAGAAAGPVPVEITTDYHRQLYRQEGLDVTTRSVEPHAWGAFLTTIFDEWVTRDVGRVFVQLFDVALGNAMGQYTLCTHAPECGAALAVLHNGDIYACDHWVEPGYERGNLADTSLRDVLASPKQRAFGKAKRTRLSDQCKSCDVRWACHGGCPKDRFAPSSSGRPDQNYLCAGYHAFFSHIEPTIVQMVGLMRAGRPVADVMGVAAGRS